MAENEIPEEDDFLDWDREKHGRMVDYATPDNEVKTEVYVPGHNPEEP